MRTEPIDNVGAGPGSTSFEALRNPEFAWFWSAAVISNTGTWMQTITVPFVIDELTHSTAWVGASVFLQFFPLLVLGPLADRSPIVARGARCCCGPRR